MKYNVRINRKFRYVKTYMVLKKVNENTNAVSKLVQGFVDRYLAGKKTGS
jgi:hypothetical protein